MRDRTGASARDGEASRRAMNGAASSDFRLAASRALSATRGMDDVARALFAAFYARLSDLVGAEMEAHVGRTTMYFVKAHGEGPSYVPRFLWFPATFERVVFAMRDAGFDVLRAFGKSPMEELAASFAAAALSGDTAWKDSASATISKFFEAAPFVVYSNSELPDLIIEPPERTANPGASYFIAGLWEALARHVGFRFDGANVVPIGDAFDGERVQFDEGAPSSSPLSYVGRAGELLPFDDSVHISAAEICRTVRPSTLQKWVDTDGVLSLGKFGRARVFLRSWATDRIQRWKANRKNAGRK